MIYILETDLHDKKPISFALTKIFGLNRSKAVKICKTLGLAQNLTFENLKKDQTLKLIKFIENSNTNINIDLKKLQVSLSKNLIQIKAYRGIRRLRKLPVRGQRTHTNAKTAKRR
jgi:small subunit ribosomal protein S13